MTHPIYDLYQGSPLKFRFHLLGLPHTNVSPLHLSCAYTQKHVKFLKMFSGRGHDIISYANEGSVAPSDVEQVQIFSEEERLKWFEKGAFDTAKGELRWDPNEMYWRVWGLKAGAELIQRVKPGDFILTVAGQQCYIHAISQFPGCHKVGTTNAFFVDYGSGHYGSWTDFCVYESSAHREQLHGRRMSTMESYTDAVIPNSFDLDDFRFGKNPEEKDERIRIIQQEPYYLFVGRIISSKGWDIAVEATRHLGVRLILVGQGDPGELPPHVINFGFANIEQRKSLMAGAIATFAPTRYREPFGGVNVESQLSGVPAITSDAGGFCETVDSRFRCTTLMEYVSAARYAATLSNEDRLAIKARAESLYSLDSIRPLYERYFHRLYMLRHAGWSEMRSWEELASI